MNYPALRLNFHRPAPPPEVRGDGDDPEAASGDLTGDHQLLPRPGVGRAGGRRAPRRPRRRGGVLRARLRRPSDADASLCVVGIVKEKCAAKKCIILKNKHFQIFSETHFKN